ncbi:ABC transporter substrate-binding protein [Bacillus sp. ISL-40]|uniref:ABC transporter substrate-binding protein n=1 Tax=unclassified Bacillus (in: firmicutes) TaxID=185979 RepID=UPI001BE7A6A4|nr:MULTISPECIES: ABC transporter substrate-binding protein [unclassified Bacillus (in: firmicutes)]MBT2696223.1 ABC transporter substrate-binding protein [Bacillus sp. ISL-40]MBT2720379.1 ABC transporter substrate-binding protein [Bacillus sp. ISL-46]MBT2743072.1 ABC transporter substrate-binding protein [Bacillus sp. ISL-77]
MKKSFLIMVSLLLLLLSACGKNNEKESDKTTGAADKLQKVSLMLDWYPNAVHSFLFVAEEKGYFKEQGLDVDIQMPADTNDPLKLVAANQIDMALSYQPQVLVARSEGIPVQSIGAIVRHPLNQLMVPADGSIKSPKDLAGKTIGYPSIPLDEAIVQTMVKADGGDAGKIKMVDVGWDLIPAMATKKTDALIGGYINHEKLLLEKEGHPMRALNPADYGVPDYYELVMVASQKGLKEKPEVYKKFMAAITEGQKYVQEHPEDGLSILMNHEDKTSPLEKDVETKSLEILLPLMDAKEKPFGYQEPETWKNTAQWLKDNKVIKDTVKAEDAFINY